MASYGLDISQVLGWTFPQLLLLNRRRAQRERQGLRFQLMLAAGTLPLAAVNHLWQGLGGEPIDVVAVEAGTAPASSSPGKIGQQSHGVDSKGNVVAEHAPLLSDIALGKAQAPWLIPIHKIDKSKENQESDG